MSPTLALVIVIVLIAANALFVAAEFSLVSAQRGAIEERAAAGDRRARIALRELTHLSYTLSAAQFGITATSLLVGFLAEGAIGDLAVAPLVDRLDLPASTTRGVVVGAAFLISTMLQMVLGELAPKNLAIARPEAVARSVTPLTRAFGIALGPLIRIFDRAAASITRRVFRAEVAEELLGGHTLDDLTRIIAASGEGGALRPHQARLVGRAAVLGDRRISEVMVPRPDVVWLRASDRVDALREAAGRTGYSRFPVHTGSEDEVLGTVHLKDLLRVPAGEREITSIRDLCSPATFVPESDTVRRFVGALRADRRTFAVVVDEYGGTAGIVTLEDIIEELVGEIEDEFDRPDAIMVRRLGPGRMRMPGTTRLDRFTELTGVALPDGEYETVAGFVMDRLGHIPGEGETVVHDDLDITVVRMQAVRVAEVDVVWQER